MVKIKVRREVLQDALNDVMEFFKTPLENSDYCLDTSKYACIEITDSYACIEKVSFWDYFSGPEEKTYTISLSGDVKVDGEELREVEELREHFHGSIPIETIEIVEWEVHEMLDFLKDKNNEYIYLTLSKSSRYLHIIDGDSVMKIRK